jgi:hypothetical protein
MSYIETQEDQQWRCMALAMYLHRYLERLGAFLGGQNIPVTLANLAEYMEAGAVNGHHEEFAAWKFAVEDCPRILRNLAVDICATGFNKMLAKGEYIPVVLIVMTTALDEEPASRLE